MTDARVMEPKEFGGRLERVLVDAESGMDLVIAFLLVASLRKELSKAWAGCKPLAAWHFPWRLIVREE